MKILQKSGIKVGIITSEDKDINRKSISEILEIFNFFLYYKKILIILKKSKLFTPIIIILLPIK